MRVALALATVAACAMPAVAADLPRKQRDTTLSATSIGQVAPDARSLLVTFSDLPGRAAVTRRLAGLGRVSPSAPGAGVWLLRPTDRLAGRAAAARRRHVVAVEWPLARHTQQRVLPAAPTTEIAPVTPPIDELFVAGKQWSLVGTSWDARFIGLSPRPTIAILDGGTDVDHPEWSGPTSPLVSPYSTRTRRESADDWTENGHGTHVASIAAAPANGVGVVGVAPALAGTAPLMSVQVTDTSGDTTDAYLIAGIQWAVQRGAGIINISAGGDGFSFALQRAVNWASRRGVLIVASVGNDGNGAILYPAGYDRVLGVGAQCGPDFSPDCPRARGVATFSQRNRTVDVIAPGVDIVSAVPAEVTEGRVSVGYARKTGTSMSAPYVAGVAALVQAANGNRLSTFQLTKVLEANADDLGAAGRDDRSGYGAVNIARAIAAQAPADDLNEPNDDIKQIKFATSDLATTPGPLAIEADLDSYDDADDVYPVRLSAGARVRITATSVRGPVSLFLWRPRTRTVETTDTNVARSLVDAVAKSGRQQVLDATVSRGGTYYVNVFARPRTVTPYTLTVEVVPPK